MLKGVSFMKKFAVSVSGDKLHYGYDGDLTMVYFSYMWQIRQGTRPDIGKALPGMRSA